MKYLLLIIALAASPAAAQPEFRLGATLGSLHFGGYADEFNQVNPGLNIGVTFRSERRLQYGFQVGAFVNSYSERAAYALGFADYRAFNLGQGEIRAGVFAGMFEYPTIAQRMGAQGWPTAGDYLLIFGPQVKYRTPRGIDYIVSFVPQYTRRVQGILTFSMSFPL